MKLKVSIVALLGVASPCFCNAVPGTKPGDFGYFHGLEPRVLKAATPKAALASRGLKVSLQHELQLHYVDGMQAMPGREVSGLHSQEATMQLTNGYRQ